VRALHRPNIGLQRTSACGLAAEAGSFGVRVTAWVSAILLLGCVSLPKGSDAYRAHCPVEIRFASGPITPGTHFRSVTDAEICLVAPGIKDIYLANSADGPGLRLERLDSRTYAGESYAEQMLGPTETAPFLVNDGRQGPPIEPAAVPEPDGKVTVLPGNYRIVLRYGLKSSWATPICVCKTASFIADRQSTYVTME